MHIQNESEQYLVSLGGSTRDKTVIQNILGRKKEMKSQKTLATAPWESKMEKAELGIADCQDK